MKVFNRRSIFLANCRLLCFLLFYTISLVVSVDFEKMRSRELRKHLLKLGHDRDELNKILDRKELKLLAEEFYSQKRQYDEDAAYRAKGVQLSIVCIVIATIFIFWEPISAFISSLRSSVDGFIYQVQERLRLISMSIDNRFPIAAISLMLATALEILQPVIQLSILAGWLIPHGSYFRRFLIPMPSFPLTLNHFLGTNKEASRSSSTTSSIGDIGNMGVNVAPMVLIWVSNYLKHKLEDFGASRLIKVVDAKQRRRDDREAVRKFRTKVQTEQEFVVMDFADGHGPTSHGNISEGTGTGHAAAADATAQGQKPRAQEAYRMASPFEQQKNSLNSSFLQHVKEGGLGFDIGNINSQSAAHDNERKSFVDDGDFWLNDSGSETS